MSTKHANNACRRSWRTLLPNQPDQQKQEKTHISTNPPKTTPDNQNKGNKQDATDDHADPIPTKVDASETITGHKATSITK